MKPNYKNWMPKGMIWSFAAGAAVALALTLIVNVNWLKILLLILTIVLAGVTVWTLLMYRAFSYDGKRQMSRQIIDGVAEHVKLPETLRVMKKGGPSPSTISSRRTNTATCRLSWRNSRTSAMNGRSSFPRITAGSCPRGRPGGC